MATLVVSRESVSNCIVTLEGLKVGSTTSINGFTICRETEGSFHIRRADEAMFGSARSVVDWMELIKKEI
jgi:hypothetical protein